MFEIAVEHRVDGPLEETWRRLAAATGAPVDDEAWTLLVTARQDGVRHERYAISGSARRYDVEVYDERTSVLLSRETVSAHASGPTTVVRFRAIALDWATLEARRDRFVSSFHGLGERS